MDQSEAARTPYSHRGCASAVVLVLIVVFGGGVGGGSGSTAACRRRGQAARGADGACRNDNEEAGECTRRGQATVAKAEAAQGQTSINQKVAAKMFNILLGLCNILNIPKENSS